MKTTSILSFLSTYAVASQSSLRAHQRRQQERDLSSESIAQTRIIGGSTVSIDRYTYAVSLQDSWGHFCGKDLHCGMNGYIESSH